MAWSKPEGNHDDGDQGPGRGTGADLIPSSTCPMNEQPIGTAARSWSFEELREKVRHWLLDRFDRSQIGEVTLLCEPKPVADDPTKLRVDRPDGSPMAVVLCSPLISPQSMAHQAACIRAARSALDERLARHVIEPVLEGELDGVSVLMLPYRQPLSDSRITRKLQKISLSPILLRWGLDVTRTTLKEASDRARLADGLTALSAASETDREVREAAESAWNALEKGAWTPRHVLMHNDLWLGNVLLGAPGASIVPASLQVDDFVVIDWCGLQFEGLPFHDLLSLATSLGCSPRRIGAEVRKTAQVVDCSRDEVRHYVSASLGQTLKTLNHFPYAQFVRLANSMTQTINNALVHF